MEKYVVHSAPTSAENGTSKVRDKVNFLTLATRSSFAHLVDAAKTGAEQALTVAQNTAESAVESVHNRTAEIAEAAQKRADRIADSAQCSVDRIASITQTAVEQVGAAAQNGLEHASNTAQDGVGLITDAADMARSSFDSTMTSAVGTGSSVVAGLDFPWRRSEERQVELSPSAREFSSRGSSCPQNLQHVWWNAIDCTQTRPPVRLKMQSNNHWARRSMEVDWKIGKDDKWRSWSSWNDPICGWFEAEKILPASVTHLTVRFKVRGVIRNFDVQAVDRHNARKWVKDAKGDYTPEVISFRFDREHRALAVDATFELAGGVEDTYVWRAWNAGRTATQEPSEWEFWEDDASRPQGKPRLEVLRAADAAAPPADSASGDPLRDCKMATQRLVSAAKALQEARRVTLDRLRCINGHLTGQWVSVNSTNTVGAGLAVASAVTLAIAPPIGIGLGIGSAAATSVAAAGDMTADHLVLADLRRYLSEDDLSSFAVAELQQSWLQARDVATAALLASGKNPDGLGFQELSLYGLQGLQTGAAVASTVVHLASRATAAIVVSDGASLASVMAMPVRVLGIVGAVASAGVAAHGWATTKSLQLTVQSKIDELNAAARSTGRWLAGMSEQVCGICLSVVELDQQARCCENSWHFSHMECLRLWEQQCEHSGRSASCPICCGPLADRTALLKELVAEDMASSIDET